MGLMRSLLLAASDSRWLRQRAPEMPFVRKAVRRFMPGERLEDALAAAAALGRHGIGAVLTQLGEDVIDLVKADDVARHYTQVLTTTRAAGLDCHISVKLSQLGLDLDAARCQANLRALVAHARELETFVWIDMEQHTRVDATLEIYRRLQPEFHNAGVCLQSYLYRTAGDLASLIPLGGGVRLVKGAYREPASVAYPRKPDVDRNFLALAKLMLSPDARAAGLRPVFGTHDRRLIGDIQRHIESISATREACEFHLLFGIQPSEQARLVRERFRVRVLISYGEEWFPWYMRRLAERPANVLFAAKSMFSN